MERLRKVILFGMLAFVLAANVGCQSQLSMKRTLTSVQETVGLKSEPVSEVICYWQRRTAKLPDPTRDGQQVLGIVGQVFMLTPSQKTATAYGDLSVMIYDVTPRPQGQPEATPAMFHFDAESLTKMRNHDERLGPCYVVFMPWPESWKDVKTIRLQARFDATDKALPEVQSQDVTMNLDFKGDSLPSIEHASFQTGARRAPDSKSAQADLRGVPNPHKVLAGQSTSVPTREKPTIEPERQAPTVKPILKPSEPSPNLVSVPDRGMLQLPPTSPGEPTITRNGDKTTSTQAWAAPPPSKLPTFVNPNLPPPPNGGIQPIIIGR
ncbi:MAG: hypothetical protein ACRC8S_13405 [Fimbriiglobus sp.]